MKLVTSSITREKLHQMATQGFGNLVKAVVDIKKGIMVVDASLHADEEALLLSKGSTQTDLWGINLYPELHGEDFIEFDSMINLRPHHGNKSRGIDDPKIQLQVWSVISKLVK